MTPEFVVVGHVVQDLLAEDRGWRLGGAAAYASLLGRNLGLRTAILTACSDDLDLEKLLPGIEIRRVPSQATTQIRNEYPEGARRAQWIPARGSVLTEKHLPSEWRDTPVVLLGPVAGEVASSLGDAFGEATILGAGAQGWLREVGPDLRVRPVHPQNWAAVPVLRSASALFLSDEDLPIEDDGERPPILSDWARTLDCVAYTRGYEGADICYRGEWRRIDAFPATPVDLTGAGDTFAAAFLIRLTETKDPWAATRFASAAASIVIEGVGIEGVPESRDAIETRMQLNPAIIAR